MRHRLTAALSAAALLGTLTACDTVREATSSASNAADKTSICIEAVRLAGFTPSTQNLEQTAEDAKKTSDDLTKLADRAADTTVRDAINGMADQIATLDVPNLDPATVAGWTKQKLDAFNTLTQACL
ncbi:bacteriophage spanin2 family protein [Actinokineospora terrae]|uniref:Lipoprotein n=1 Tax=Actinokineospora terrae TaxID=155974 RepID=A0A1H9S3M7_9PSEU|nr:bacteriophage spanin2 family protein [Actinokineospora terrae]SER79591.1 hypothetical protein SAMN04487818_105256 [Actinokineospora terrae]